MCVSRYQTTTNDLDPYHKHASKVLGFYHVNISTIVISNIDMFNLRYSASDKVMILSAIRNHKLDDILNY